jgi:hypothetical protein
MNLPLFIGEPLAITPPQEIVYKPTKKSYEGPKHKKNDIKRETKREIERRENTHAYMYTQISKYQA